MRSMKYLPSVSTVNSLKYLRQILNTSLQKLTAIDVNIIIEKYVNQLNRSGVTFKDSEALDDTRKAATAQAVDRAIGETATKLSDDKPKTSLDGQRVEEENKVFESAMNAWIQSKSKFKPNPNAVKSQTSDILGVKLKDMPQLLDPNTDVSTLPSFMSRSAVEQRINQLLQYMSRPDSALSTRRRLRELSSLLATYPDAIHYAVANRAIQTVIRLNQRSEELMVRQHSNQVLALLGYCEPPKGNGIRILSIDGGGTRGILVIEILRELERLSGKPVHEMFDLICGVSTGAIIGMLLGAMRTPIDECEEYYHRFSSHLFKSDFLRGAGRLIWSHAYYDTTVWEKILKDIYGETLMMESKQCAGTPSVLAISALMNKPSIEAFLFRNYELPIHTRSLSQYEGSSKYKIWQAVRASAAAPGYFEEIRLDQYVHQDGGLLINNPTAVAVHEAKMLWPSEHIQCVLSLGSGRFVPQLEEPPSRTTSLKTKIIKLIDSATDTEMVDRLMKDLLPPKTYFRINPYLTEMGTLDENRREKLDQMKADARKYLRKNDNKFTEAVTELTQKRKVRQHLEDWLRLQYYLRV